MSKKAEKKFHDYVAGLGLRLTRQREVIAAEFLGKKGHLSAEQLLQSVRLIDKGISLATLYRTLKLLEECGLARTHRFGDEYSLYEPKLDDRSHHDHLICIKCGKIVEFVDSQIEKGRNEIARRHGFREVWHKLELYGHCDRCHE